MTSSTAHEKLLLRASGGLSFFNTSKMDLSKLGEYNLKDKLESYIQPDGLLGISTRGHARFQILSAAVLPDKLTMAVVDLWKPEEPKRVPNDLCYLVDWLKDIETQAQWPVAEAACYADATWVGFKLAQLLPFDLAFQQSFLEMMDPLERLVVMADVLARVRSKK